MKVFVKRYPEKGELPKCKGRSYRVYVTSDKGIVCYDKYDGWEYNIEWWLEEIELPSEEDVFNKSTFDNDPESFEQGANYILNLLKQR